MRSVVLNLDHRNPGVRVHITEDHSTLLDIWHHKVKSLYHTKKGQGTLRCQTLLDLTYIRLDCGDRLLLKPGRLILPIVTTAYSCTARMGRVYENNNTRGTAIQRLYKMVHESAGWIKYVRYQIHNCLIYFDVMWERGKDIISYLYKGDRNITSEAHCKKVIPWSSVIRSSSV